MLDWDKLRIFHTVATAKSFTRAGEILNLSQSAISRQISALEESLQVSLFNRHARGLMLTEQGDILFLTANDVLERLSATENALLETKERPRGSLKITTPVAFGTNWLTPRMREFSEAYPEISITMLVDDRELDLTMREADVAIRLFPAKHPDLIQKKLTVLYNSIYASNNYLNTYGIPENIKDLQHHKLILFSDEQKQPFSDINWILNAIGKSNLPHKSAFKINSMSAMLKAVKSGIGVAGLPEYMVQSKNISKILPEIKGPQTDMYLIYPSEMRNSKRINVFKEFILKKLAEGGLGRAR